MTKTPLVRREKGMLITELAVALTILAIIVIPLSFVTRHEQQRLRASFYRAVAMEIVDGELEVLAGGGWSAVSVGTSSYPVQAQARRSLPAGEFKITRTPSSLSLRWTPVRRGTGGPVTRTIVLP